MASFVVTVILASPTFLPIILPPLFTVATRLLEDFQLTFGSEVLFDHTVFFSLYVWPTPILIFFLSSFTVLLSLATLTLHFALWLYLVSVHVIVHEPILLPVTLPDASTVAIDELDVDHSAVFLAFSGFITF